MSDFKIGDKVVIREWDDLKSEFKATIYKEGIDLLNGVIFANNMYHLCGRTATIIDINGTDVLLDFDDKTGDTNWKFTVEMIKPFTVYIDSFYDKNQLYKELIRVFGDKQVIVAIEELSELQKELCKYLRGSKKNNNLVEELADVIIMIEQMQIYFNISKEKIDELINDKLMRTQKRYGLHNV